ncbi:TPA: SH3 domain-containing protein [Bacillus cereus]|nr:SH3 domain-containing protein [Bacillus cereus]
MLRRLSISTLLLAFMFTLFTFNGSAFAATHSPETDATMAVCKNGGTVGEYGAKMRNGYTVKSNVLHTFSKGTNITGTWVTGEYVQGHYSNSNKWLKVTYKGQTGYVSITTLYNTTSC